MEHLLANAGVAVPRRRADALLGSGVQAHGIGARGRRRKAHGFVRTPEEAQPPAIARAAEAAYPYYRDALAQTPDLSAVSSDPILLEKHLALTDEFSLTSAETVDIIDAVAEKKILDAATLMMRWKA